MNKKALHKSILWELDLLGFCLQAEGSVSPVLKEYEAPWLDNVKTITRDAYGRFSSASSIFVSAVSDLMGDPVFRRGVRLSLTSQVLKALEAIDETFPLFERVFGEYREKLNKDIEAEIVSLYGDDKSAFSQALRKSRLKTPPPNASFEEKLDYEIALWKAYNLVLADPEKYVVPPPPPVEVDKNEQKNKIALPSILQEKWNSLDKIKQQQIASLVKVSIPVVTAFGIALGWEVAIPLLMAGQVSLESAAISAGISTGLDLVFQKGLEQLDVDNPWASFGASFVAGMIGGGIAGVRDVKKIKRLQEGASVVNKASRNSVIKRGPEGNAFRATRNTLKKQANELDTLNKQMNLVSAKRGEVTKDSVKARRAKLTEDFLMKIKNMGLFMSETQMDEIIQAGKPTYEIPAHTNLKYMQDAGKPEDRLLFMIRQKGKDGMPSQVSSEEFDSLIQAGEIKRDLYRGLSKKAIRTGDVLETDLHKEFVQGELYSGKGIYGNGTYFAADKTKDIGGLAGLKDASVYGEDHIIRAGLAPDFKLAHHEDLVKLQEEIIEASESVASFLDKGLPLNQEGVETISKSWLIKFKTIMSDESALSLAMGYDGHLAQNTISDLASEIDEFVIYNRTKMIVQNTDMGTHSSGNKL